MSTTNVILKTAARWRHLSIRNQALHTAHALNLPFYECKAILEGAKRIEHAPSSVYVSPEKKAQWLAKRNIEMRNELKELEKELDWLGEA